MRGLEILLGLIFHSVEGCEHLIVAILKGESSIASPGDQEHQPASTVNVLVETWRNSSSWKELERILSTVESGEDEEFTARDLHDRLDEALKESLSIKEGSGTSTLLSENPSTDSQNILVDGGSTPDVNGSPQATRQGGGGMPATESATVETPPSDTLWSSNPLQNWPELLDIYFASTNSWIPIVLKNDAFRAAYTLSAAEPQRGQAAQLSHGDQACLFSMLAYARYTECIVIGKDGSSKDIQNQFANVFARASQLISHYESQRDIGHVQAMLIFTILYYAQGNLRMAWSFIGKAVYHIVELGLLNFGIAQSLPLNLRSKRVVLSCFVLETLLSARLHRRPYLRACDLQEVGMLDADGIEEWEPWRPASLLPSSTTCNLPRLSQQPARVLSTFNLLVQATTILNDNLQGHVDDADNGVSQRHVDIIGLLQSQDHINNLIAQSEAQEASPQAANLMLATAACLQNLIPAGADVEHTNLSCPSSPQAYQILASVAQRAKQQRAFMLPPFSDVYLNIIENKNKDSTFSHETHDPMTLVWEVRARYNWGTVDFDRCHSPEAMIRNHREPLMVPNTRSEVLRQGPSDQSGPRNQFSTINTTRIEADGGGTALFAPRDPSAALRLQPEE